ncbi:hypothetical protein [Bradyrhizobium cenepequi]
MAGKVAVAALNRSGKYAILADDRIAPFTEMFDEDGEETADISVAVTAVAKHPDGLWIVIALGEWESVTLH